MQGWRTLAGDGGLVMQGWRTLAGDGGFAAGARAGGLGGRPEPPKSIEGERPS
jgi:hypothetical protein